MCAEAGGDKPEPTAASPRASSPEWGVSTGMGTPTRLPGGGGAAGAPAQERVPAVAPEA